MRVIKRIAFGTAGILILAMTYATVLEKTSGTDKALSAVYHSPLFVAGWAVMSICATAYILRKKLHRHLFTLLMHLSFLVILIGAFVTHRGGIQGSIHLRFDSPADTFVTSEGKEAPLPFVVQLHDFHIDYYKGSFAPMDFVSQIQIIDGNHTVNGEISMNRILQYRHYRFYQSSYDNDRKGTTLSVAYDPWGIGITYTGYALLLLAMGGFFFQKGSKFRRLLHHPALRRNVMLPCLLGLFASNSVSAETPKHLPSDIAAEMGDLYVYYHDRICPLQTLARDFTLKIYGETTYKGLTAEQVFSGWLFFYDDWKTEPFIRIKSRDIREKLGIDGKLACLNDFFGTAGYKLKEDDSSSSIALKREEREANEKFNLISMVATGSSWKIFPCPGTGGKTNWLAPTDPLPQELSNEQRLFIRKSFGLLNEQLLRKDHIAAWKTVTKIKKYQEKTASEVLPSPRRFKAEKIYNQVNHTRALVFCCLSLGFGCWAYYVWRLMHRPIYNKVHRWVTRCFSLLLGGVAVYLLGLICLRGYISGHLPLSNGYETMQTLAACASVLSLFYSREFDFSVAFGFLIAGFALLVSLFGASNPPITPLMPVLSSPLLSLHVIAIMLAYALLAFILSNGITALLVRYTCRKKQELVEQLYIISRILLYPAVCLLTLGIFIGAVWANVSWGRYWGWDPKEVWALITLLIYAAALHPGSLPAFRQPVFFHWFSIFAFLSVLTTYFGVNFFLGGMHGYA